MKTIELIKNYNYMADKMVEVIEERRQFIMNALTEHNGYIERKNFCKAVAEEKGINFEKQFNDIIAEFDGINGKIMVCITSVKYTEISGTYLISGVGMNNYFYQDVFCRDESAIAYFIYVMLSKGRLFKQNEVVMVELPNDVYKPARIVKDTDTYYQENKKIEVLLLDNEDCETDNIELKEIEAEKIYKMSDKICPKCGKILFYEHNQEIDYPYYCPECDENFYECEI